jgi:metallo-beta-lactamase family protein
MSKLTIYGGAGMVTGANFMLDTGSARVLVDCGLMQGDRFAAEKNCDDFAYDPRAVDVLFVTHAHADHIGRIPKLVRDGFSGVIYSTEATKDLADVMLRDALKVMEYESKHYGTPSCYEGQDIDAALSLWKGVSYKEKINLGGSLSAHFNNAGHILGSGFVVLERHGKTFVFTGDIGNVPQPLLDAPDIPKDYEYLLMESVYGDRLHEEVSERSELLRLHIEETIQKKGTLIIPAFSLERTQAMLYEINNFVEKGMMQPVPVFLDSPLAISVTDIYRRHKAYLKESVQHQIDSGDDIFDFPKLTFTRTISDSKEIDDVSGQKVIIAGSGMSHGGRILGHEKRYLEDPKTTLLLVGYQAVGSLGRKLSDGAKKVRIIDSDIRVRAKVAQIRGYSGHADRDQLIDFVAEGGEKAKKIFVTMGEERSSLFLVQRLRDYLGVNASAPDIGDSFDIDI